MKFSKILTYSFIVFLGTSLLTIPAFQLVHTWKIKDDFNIKFTHEEAEGIFKKFNGKVVFDEKTPENAAFDVSIDVKSVDTGNPMKDESIAGDSWINAEKYPQITFKSSGAEKKGDFWQTTGVLALHGVEQPLVLPFSFKNTESGAVFESNFVLKFVDFKLSDDSNESIKLQLKIPVSKE